LASGAFIQTGGACIAAILILPSTPWWKQHTQKIERKHTMLRARIKRFVRKTICFSCSILMHDLVIGLFINRYEFGDAV